MYKLHSRFPQYLSEELKTRFESFMIESRDEFVDFMAVLFGYLVVSEQEIDIYDDLLDLAKYPTLISLFDNRKKLKVNTTGWVSEEGIVSIPKDSFSSVTWTDQITASIENFVNDKVSELLLAVNVSGQCYLGTFISEKELQDELFAQAVIDHFVEIMGGEDYFKQIVDYHMTILYDQDPVKFFKIGEERGRALRDSVKADFNKSILDLVSGYQVSNSKVSYLWEAISDAYLDTHGEPLPQGQMSSNFYQTKLKPILHSLKKHKVEEREIRELTVFGASHFSPEVMSDLFEFSYI